MSGEVRVRREAEIATVELDNPGRLNALSRPMWLRLAEVMEQLGGDDTLRAVVVRGAGSEAFAAGADIAEFARERADAEQARGYGRDMARALRAVAHCRHPVIAMIRGACVGGGLEIACACDLRICGESARFGAPVKNLGLVMGYDELRGLIELCGKAVALEIALEGRVFGAAEARDKGLVNRVAADDRLEEEVYATARRIAEGAPLVARWHKRFVNRLMDPRPLSAPESDESYACFDTEDFRTGVRAFLAKERARFRGR